MTIRLKTFSNNGSLESKFVVSVNLLCFSEILRKWFICKGGCFSVAETEKFIFWRDNPAPGGMTKERIGGKDEG